jgi:hypothetical protein
MATAAATRARGGRRFRSAEEMREVLDRVLTVVNRDENAGPLLQATGMRFRLRCPELKLVLSIAASERSGSYIEWSFSGSVGWKPRLELTMGSEVANRYLQGAESVPIAIARGRIRCSGESRSVLLYLPAARLIQRPYKRLVRAEYPHLALD